MQPQHRGDETALQKSERKVRYHQPIELFHYADTPDVPSHTAVQKLFTRLAQAGIYETATDLVLAHQCLWFQTACVLFALEMMAVSKYQMACAWRLRRL